jgi:hypothetical protein
VVPAGELLDGMPNRGVVDVVELRVEPTLEQRQMVVALRQESVVLEDAPQVLDTFGWRLLIQRIVGQREFATAKPAGEVLGRGGAEPREYAFRPITRGEDVREAMRKPILAEQPA